MDYFKASPDVVGLLYKAHDGLRKSGSNTSLCLLLEIRTSQINQCSYCCALHTKKAREHGISEDKIARLAEWEETSGIFSERERLALAWTEAVTRLSPDRPELRARLEHTFTEKELVDLTASVALMNALNRIATSLGGTP